jgi:hypothetical protein
MARPCPTTSLRLLLVPWHLSPSSYQRVGSSQCAPADYELADKISTVDITLTSEELGRATTESVKRLYVIGACAALQQRWTSNNSASWAHPPS